MATTSDTASLVTDTDPVPDCDVAGSTLPTGRDDQSSQDRENEAEVEADAVQVPMTREELVAYTQRELDSDAERHAGLQESAGAVPRVSHTGATLDLSRKMLQALPLEFIELIKDRVERYVLDKDAVDYRGKKAARRISG